MYVKFPAVCKHFGWDPARVCGPCVMAAGGPAEGNCCYFHPQGSPLHNQPKVAGKPFVLKDHQSQLQTLGLTVPKPELAALRDAGKKPPGTPRKIGGAMVYPVPHFA